VRVGLMPLVGKRSGGSGKYGESGKFSAICVERGSGLVVADRCNIPQFSKTQHERLGDITSCKDLNIVENVFTYH